MHSLKKKISDMTFQIIMVNVQHVIRKLHLNENTEKDKKYLFPLRACKLPGSAWATHSLSAASPASRCIDVH